MDDEKKNNIGEKIAEVVTAENIQRYIMGTKKNGQPRAVYDIVKDFAKPKKKKKKKHKKATAPVSTYEVYLANKKAKKKRKKKKAAAHWHI